MAEITQYVDPGVYTGEVIVPASVSNTTQRTLALLSIAPRTRRVTTEQVVRGKIYAEELTVAASSPHIAELSEVSNRSRNNAALYLNGNLLGVGDWSLLPAVLTGGEWATSSLTFTALLNKFTLSVDRKVPVTVTFAQSAHTPAQFVTALNAALLAEYGAAYGSVASTVIQTGDTNVSVVLTSPTSGSDSAIQVFPSLDMDAIDMISGSAWAPSDSLAVMAKTRIQISDELYNSAAEYTIDYVSVENLVDALANANTTTPLVDISSIGTTPGGNDYRKNTDYKMTGNTVDWDTTSQVQASVTSLDLSTPPTLTTNIKLKFSLNDRDAVTVTLAAGAVVIADVVEAINAKLDDEYGPEFNHAAEVVGDTFTITAPVMFASLLEDLGAASNIRFEDVDGNAFAVLFGTASLPYTVSGTGKIPAYGAVYYAAYDYTRPASDYTKAHRIFSPDQLFQYTSPLTISNYLRNYLAVGGQVCFENGATSIYLIQVNDSTTPGAPTQLQYQAALDVAKQYSGITEVVPLMPPEDKKGLDIQVATMNHVSNQSSLLEKHPRRGWYGMPRGTSVGDPDTPDTFIHRSVQTLQPGSKSSGRGRQFLLAPCEVSKTIALDTGLEVTLDLDGQFVAAAVAAAFTALPNPSSVLMGIPIVGFDSEGFGTFLDGERHAMAENGVMVVTYKDGLVRIYDPVSTEAGGGKLVQFVEPSSSPQKDAVVALVNQLVDANLTGVVPDDLSDFISEIKTYISLGINSAITSKIIAPYRDSSGIVRQLDMRSDIVVLQNPTDPRKFNFKYWFMLKYPAKWFFGEFSVDNPFFAPQ